MTKNNKTNYQLGQCFLKSRNLSFKFVESFNIANNFNCKHDVIVEVGFGNGSLTDFIFKECEFQTYIGFDYDSSFALLSTMPKFDKGHFFIENILKTDIKAKVQSIHNGKNDKINIITNLPFNISKDFCLQLCTMHESLGIVTIGLQEEFVNNLFKNTYAISFLMKLFFSIKKEFLIEKTNFVPSPKVDCYVITLTPKKFTEFDDLDIVQVYTILKTLFKNRKKKIKNNKVLKFLEYLKLLNLVVDDSSLFLKRIHEIDINIMIKWIKDICTSINKS